MRKIDGTTITNAIVLAVFAMTILRTDACDCYSSLRLDLLKLCLERLQRHANHLLILLEVILDSRPWSLAWC